MALLKEVENSLNESLQCTANGGLAVEGSEALAAIINAGVSPLEKGVLARMDNQDPKNSRVGSPSYAGLY